MIYLFSLLGYGDNLITGALLESFCLSPTRFRSIGTGVTARVWAILNRPIQPHEILFSDVPAFYTIRNSGVWAAICDLRKARAWASASLVSSDQVVFENTSRWRHQLLLGQVDCTVLETRRLTTAYMDRLNTLKPYIGGFRWERAVEPVGSGQRLLINPDARSADRRLPTRMLDSVVNTAKACGTAVAMIDRYGEYRKFENRVEHYLLDPTFKEAVVALQNSDRYFGPDSFFMHLAYYLRIPQVAVFHRKWTYFRPPGLLEQGAVLYFDELENDEYIGEKVSWLLAGGSSGAYV